MRWAIGLPVVVICLVMLILKLNIDPSTQTMLLDLSVPPQTHPLSASNLPPSIEACNGSGLYMGGVSSCSGGYAFRTRGEGRDSRNMSHVLLMVSILSSV